jgi:hypothetical protein
MTKDISEFDQTNSNTNDNKFTALGSTNYEANPNQLN